MSVLNIDTAVGELVVKAINKHSSNKEAIKALGCSEKTFYRYKKRYNISQIKKYEAKSTTTA